MLGLPIQKREVAMACLAWHATATTAAATAAATTARHAAASAAARHAAYAMTEHFQSEEKGMSTDHLQYLYSVCFSQKCVTPKSPEN